MSRIMFIGICTLLAAASIDANAQQPQPSMSATMEKAGATFARWRISYFYPAFGNCQSYFSGLSEIWYAFREVDANGNEVRWDWRFEQGQFVAGWWFEPGFGWYSYCQTVATYDTLTSHGTLYVWMDIGGNSMSGPQWAFTELPNPY